MVKKMKTAIRIAIDKLPYIRVLRKVADDTGAYLPGHFYSPIPSRDEVAEVVARIRTEPTGKGDLPGIRLNGDKQLELLKIFEAFYKDLPFPEEQTEGCRYY